MDNSINVDKAAHRIYGFHQNSPLLAGIYIDGDFRAFYHESRLYSVWNKQTHIVSLVYANNFRDAIRRVKNSLKEREENG